MIAKGKRLGFVLTLSYFACTLWAQVAQAMPIEVHARIATPALGSKVTNKTNISATDKTVALTLDACSGKFDADLLDFLIRKRIPATIFVTKKWLDKNPQGVAIIKANLDLFDVEDHGEKHIPAIIGPGKKVYGMAGEPDIASLQREVTEGAKAITSAMGTTPQWYRGASAKYDPEAITEINRLGYKIAGFSLNADQGATLRKQAIINQFKRLQAGDVIIAHMNKPASDSAEGLSIALAETLKQGFVFVRLDQVELQKVNMQRQQLAKRSLALSN